MAAGLDDFLTGLRAQIVRAAESEAAGRAAVPAARPAASPRPWHVRPRIALAFALGVLAPVAIVAVAIGLSTGGDTPTGPVVGGVGGSTAAFVAPVVGETPSSGGSAPRAAYSLAAVAARSAGDAWAVGARRDDMSSSSGDSFVLHFDGAAWRESQTPDIGPLDAVAVTPAGEVWVLGAESGEILRLSDAWERASTGIPTGTMLEALAASPSGDVWIAGSKFGAAFVASWEGDSWVEAALPQPTPRGALLALSATPAGDVWAVGSDDVGQSGVVLRSDGVAWNVVPAQDGTSDGWPLLVSIAAVSPTDAWIAGAAGDLLHWDGSVWTVSSTSFVARSAAAGATDDVWLAAADRRGVAHWDGETWNEIGAAEMGFSHTGVEIAAVAACPGGVVWAIGTDDDAPVIAQQGGDGWHVIVDSVVTEGDR